MIIKLINNYEFTNKFKITKHILYNIYKIIKLLNFITMFKITKKLVLN